MLRAVRFAAKLNFGIEKHTVQPIRDLAPMLREIPSARLFEEVLKLFLSGHARSPSRCWSTCNCSSPLFPASAEALEYNPTYTHTLISEALINTDLRIKQNKPVTPAFLFAALLWPALPARVLRLQERGMPPIPAMQEAAHELIAEQCQRIAIPKRFTMPIREIWDMQERLPRRSGKRADLLLDNPRFRAGYDFLLLRESAGEETDGLGEWWTDYQDANDSERRDMIRDLGSRDDGTGAGPRKRRAAASASAPATRRERIWERIYIGLGSNLATRRTVAQRLRRWPGPHALVGFRRSIKATRCCPANRATPTRSPPSTATWRRWTCSMPCKPSRTTRAASAWNAGAAHPGSGYPAVR
jgi:poly(A) polymerase